jgi:adapter protein MecA 1/2
MLSEYGCLEKAPSSVLAYLEEHCEVIIAENALQELSNI